MTDQEKTSDLDPSNSPDEEGGAVVVPKKKKSLLRRLVKWGVFFSFLGVIAVAGAIIWALLKYGPDLPDHEQLADYQPKVITRVHAGDGSLLQEYSREPRLFVPIEAVPQNLINAFLAAEDKNFYNHFGLDIMGIVRSVVVNVQNLATGSRRLVGASTITQQMARNFLLTLDQRMERKIKEMILSLRIEKAFTKDEILELYLNEINMGNRSYGIAAAALNYFNRSLDELSLAEMAYLAALPKAPHNYHPVRRKARAMARRNWVLERMNSLGFITDEQKLEAQAEDLVMRKRNRSSEFKADYFVEEVRRELMDLYGSDKLYEGGLSVRTTLEPRLQKAAEKAMQDGLIAYDRRHGYRGPLQNISISENWWEELEADQTALGVENWQKAVVLELQDEGAIIGFEDRSYGWIPFEEMKWARRWIPGQRYGLAVKTVAEVLRLGDMIVVEAMNDGAEPYPIFGFFDAAGNEITSASHYALKQIPDIGGALVALDPHTGRVLAMVGGFSYDISQFNRATQAERQPGSAFKPFVYAAALEEGFTPSSLVLDAAFVMDQGYGLGKWKPRNSSNQFYGPSTLRLGIEKSRNLMTVRLAQNIGMEKVIEIADRFGIGKNIQPHLSMSLGAGEISLLKLTAAYGMLVNGGKEVTPTLIDRIQDRRGRTILRHDDRPCVGCDVTRLSSFVDEPVVPDDREQVIDPAIAYQSVSMLEGVVQRGTGRRIRSLGIPLAGKTGTTNNWVDGWFVGFSPDLAVGVFVGFDRPRTMGNAEEGSAVAVPIFRDFMGSVLSRNEAIPFRVPPGIRLVRVNAKTGLPAGPFDKDVILEAFIPGTEPTGKRQVLDGSNALGQTKTRKGIY